MKKNERLDALRILIQLMNEKTPLSHLLTPGLSPLSKDICFGVSRHYFRLQALADCLIKKRPKEMDVWLSLLIGLYQLHFLRIPDYAVVKETVALVQACKKIWAKGLVNAVLRTYCRERETILERLKNNQAFIYGHPEWFIQRVQLDWPNQWQTLLKANDEHPPMTLRVNQAHGDTSTYLARLNEMDIKATPHPYAPYSLTLEQPCDVHDLPGFAAGDVSVQDTAAQLAAPLLDLKPGLRILDACCAPGGKTCHILETESKLAICVGLDIEKQRLSRVQENLNRLHLHAILKQGDAAKPSTWWDGIPFDRILLDAPCSATGVIRRHPDIKLLRTAADITAIATVQKTLLKSLWPLLVPGGILIYATCSILPEENEQQIAQFVTQNSDCVYEKQVLPWGQATMYGQQILPGDENMDGFFYSILKKVIQ